MEAKPQKTMEARFPPAVYEKLKPVTCCEKVSFPDTCERWSSCSTASEMESNDEAPTLTSPALTSVSDTNVPYALTSTGRGPEQVSGSKSDSDGDCDSDTELEELIENRNSTIRSGRQLKASARFDV